MKMEKKLTEVQAEFKQRMDYDELMNCMRCGFCLPSCPTYVQTDKYEGASPRGRIALIKGVVDGLIEPDEEFEEQLNLCLGCRACEPVCPSDVKYGHLLEDARDILNKKKKHKLPVKFARQVAFEQLFPNKDRLQTVHGLLGFYQKSKLRNIVQSSGVLKVLPGNLATMEKILPDVPSRKEMKNRPRHLQPLSTQKAKVAFFSGCVMDTMFMQTNDATMKLLQHVGCEIVIPEEQTCCGALHAHSGEKDSAKELAKKNIEAFEKLDVDYIISNAGGCGALLVEYDHLLKDEPEWKERAQGFVAKMKDISEVLVELGLHEMELSVPEQVVTYQESCHLRNVMRVSRAPRKLLQSIGGATFKEMKENEFCCGSAGIYNLIQQEMSMKILDQKMKNVEEVQPQVIVTGNPGCLLQMRLGIEREGLQDQMRALHLVDFLLESIPQ